MVSPLSYITWCDTRETQQTNKQKEVTNNVAVTLV